MDATNTFVDALTGLPNRRYALWRFEEELRRYERFGHGVGIVWIFLEGLAELEQRSGPNAVLQVVRVNAHHLVQHSRNPIVLTRFNEDAFAAILPNSTRRQAMSYASRMERLLALVPADHDLAPRLEVVAVPDDAVSARELLRAGDAVVGLRGAQTPITIGG